MFGSIWFSVIFTFSSISVFFGIDNNVSVYYRDFAWVVFGSWSCFYSLYCISLGVVALFQSRIYFRRPFP